MTSTYAITKKYFTIAGAATVLPQDQTAHQATSLGAPSINDLKAAGLYVNSYSADSVVTSDTPHQSSAVSLDNHHRPSAVTLDTHHPSSAVTSDTHHKQCFTVTSSTGIVVYIASKTEQGKRKWDKTSYCYFCDKTSTSCNISAYMLSVHKAEPQVAEILAKPKSSPERALLLEKLRNLGNFKHNIEVIKHGEGQLIPWRAPSEPVDAAEYCPCEHCLGFFLKKELWRHENKCKFNTCSSMDNKKERRVISRSQMLLPALAKYSNGLRDNIFSSMKADEILLVVRNDNLIVSYGEKLYEKHGHLKHMFKYIKQKLRELARFLLFARKYPEITDL